MEVTSTDSPPTGKSSLLYCKRLASPLPSMICPGMVWQRIVYWQNFLIHATTKYKKGLPLQSSVTQGTANYIRWLLSSTEDSPYIHWLSESSGMVDWFILNIASHRQRIFYSLHTQWPEFIITCPFDQQVHSEVATSHPIKHLLTRKWTYKHTTQQTSAHL